ncbi:hypothetical protein KPL74_01885 [Bacillus sp. NP157]|nr:hypothetical protein KPL74_01885 [Bacillus sp. NP157]
MSHVFRILFISLLSIFFAGCASMPGADPSHPPVSATTKGAALKGCALGAVAGSAIGLIKGGGISSALKWGAGGCAAGGVTAGVVSYRAQLKEARALEADAKAQGLAPVVTTRDVTPADSKAPEPALERLVLPLDAKDTASHGSATRVLLEKAGRIAGADSTGQAITMTVAGSAQDRAWLRSVLAPVAGSARIVDRPAAAPSVELSPVPSVAPAASAPAFDARTGTWSPAKGGH